MRTLDTFDFSRRNNKTEEYNLDSDKPANRAIPYYEYKGGLWELDLKISKGEAKLVKRGTRLVIEFYN